LHCTIRRHVGAVLHLQLLDCTIRWHVGAFLHLSSLVYWESLAIIDMFVVPLTWQVFTC
ncbi:hypothetical protein DFQ01_12638, partial [Paenibacillus cellulosilyticus]